MNTIRILSLEEASRHLKIEPRILAHLQRIGLVQSPLNTVNIFNVFKNNHVLPEIRRLRRFYSDQDADKRRQEERQRAIEAARRSTRK